MIDMSVGVLSPDKLGDLATRLRDEGAEAANEEVEREGGPTVNCPGITAKGTASKGVVPVGASYCAAHDPEQAERRRRDNARAGRHNAKHGLAEIRMVKERLWKMHEDVVAGRLHTGKAHCANQLLGNYIKACDAETKRASFDLIDLPEFQELRREVKELQQRAEEARANGGHRWQA